MTDVIETLSSRIQQRFTDLVQECVIGCNELTITVPASGIHSVCLALRDEGDFAFDILIDLCGVDYLDYGDTPWQGARFAVVYHLLSVRHNRRLRVKCFLDENALMIDSVTDVWASANWYEREAFDLFGILFAGHPDLRRLLTDYGFIGHPFRKDFPMVGNVEMRYDPEKQRVVYEPVKTELRVVVPKVIRHDHRYLEENSQGEMNSG